jgi:NADPH-dependent 7-cyano-7-deazaguanine reductase QueF
MCPASIAAFDMPRARMEFADPVQFTHAGFEALCPLTGFPDPVFTTVAPYPSAPDLPHAPKASRLDGPLLH